MTLTNNIRITLGDTEYDLKPSLKAATAVSQRFGGLMSAQQAVAGLDLASISHVIRQGISMKAISTDDLNEAIYETGARNLMSDVMRYITRLSNGGRDPDETDATDEDEQEPAGNGGEV